MKVKPARIRIELEEWEAEELANMIHEIYTEAKLEGHYLVTLGEFRDALREGLRR